MITDTNSVTKKAVKSSQPRLFHTLYNTPEAFRMGQETRDREIRGEVATKVQHDAPAPPQPAYTEGGMVFVNGAQRKQSAKIIIIK